MDVVQAMAQRNIVVKSFCDIPMADVEMIFPEKKVYIKPFILIQLVVTIALAIFTIVSTLVQVRPSQASTINLHAASYLTAAAALLNFGMFLATTCIVSRATPYSGICCRAR